jgi:hypothetical protein
LSACDPFDHLNTVPPRDIKRKGSMKPIEIFRPGTHTAMSGQTIAFTEADLSATASAYDVALHEAPIVVGHPKDNAPAYGWVTGLALAGTSLAATPGQVDPAFAEMVRKGRFKKVSASFYAPDAPGNPKPGVYYLRHVGFLGAQPPAVKGLKPIAFAASDEGIISFDEDDAMTIGTIASLFRGLRDWMISQVGQEKADTVLPSYSIDNLVASAAQEALEPDDDPAVLPSYREPPPKPKDTTMVENTAAPSAAQAAELAAREAALLARETAFAERDAAARAADDAAFLDAQITAGRFLPALRPATLAFMARLDAAEVVEFAEGAKGTERDQFRALLGAWPKVVEFREVAGDIAPLPEDADGVAIAAAATAYQERQSKLGFTVSNIDAVRAVTGKGASA